MKLTKENFMEFFEQKKEFWMLDGKYIKKCEPLELSEQLGRYRCFVIERKTVEWFFTDVLHFLGMQSFGRKYFTTYETAVEAAREALIGEVGYWNESRFKDNPIKLYEDSQPFWAQIKTLNKFCKEYLSENADIEDDWATFDDHTDIHFSRSESEPDAIEIWVYPCVNGSTDTSGNYFQLMIN